MSDGSDIDNALIARLGGDAALLALCPDGVYQDVAPEWATRFVLVTILDPHDEGVFGGRALEDTLYLVEARFRYTPTAAAARFRSTPTAGDPQAAAVRIDALLEDQPLTVPGFTWMATFREARERSTEVDAIDVSVRWARRGGHYRVQMALPAPTRRRTRDHGDRTPNRDARVER